MRRLLSCYTTPFLTTLFVISLVTGVALFLHLGPVAFHGLHEWLSLALILPFLLHLWKNWRPMTAYFKHAPMAVAVAVSLAVSLPFFLDAGGAEVRREGPVAFRFAASAMTHSAAELAPLFDLTEAELVARLTTAGFALATPDQPLVDAATAAGKDVNALLSGLMAAQAE
jgi:hypothetical protein